MSSTVTALPARSALQATAEPAWVRLALISLALAFLSLFLFVPLVAVFVEAFKKGWDVYIASIVEPDALSAVKLTLIAAGIWRHLVRRVPLTYTPALWSMVFPLGMYAAAGRELGEADGLFGGARINTLPFNGYADEVASLYAGMDLTKFY